jgi:hypothetical protein
MKVLIIFELYLYDSNNQTNIRIICTIVLIIFELDPLYCISSFLSLTFNNLHDSFGYIITISFFLKYERVGALQLGKRSRGGEGGGVGDQGEGRKGVPFGGLIFVLPHPPSVLVAPPQVELPVAKP